MNPGFPQGPEGPHPFWEQIKDVHLDEFTTMSMLFQMPFVVEEEDIALAKKHYPIVIRNVLIGAVLGVGLNLQLKRIPNFLLWNRFLRYGTRIPTFFLPFGLFYKDTEKRMSDLHKSLRKYQRRFINFQRTGDFKYIDPDRKLAKMGMGP